MNYQNIPQAPRDLTLPGLTFKSKARQKYERAMWPRVKQDQHTLLPVEKLGPPQEYCKLGDRVFNLSRMGKWSNKTIQDFYRRLSDDNGDLHDLRIIDVLLQWEFIICDTWRDLFHTPDHPQRTKRLETIRKQFKDWANSLTPTKETAFLKEIQKLDYKPQWKMLRMFMTAKARRRLTFDEYPKRPVAANDPYWPYVREVLKKESDRLTETYGGGDEFYDFARKFLGPNGMRYYKHFNDGAYWR
jgi:hypothetical protein